MELTYKKIGLLIGFFALVVVMGFLLYALFFRAAPTPAVPSDSSVDDGSQLPQADSGSGGGIAPTDSGQLPSGATVGAETEGGQPLVQPGAIAGGGVTQTTLLSAANSLAPIVDASGNSVLYYNNANGTFERAGQNAAPAPFSDKIFFNAQKVTWAPSKRKAVIEYPDDSNIVYDFQTSRQFSLPKHWQDFDFSPDSARIIAKSIGSDPDNRWLVIANDDGSQAQALEPIGEKDATVYPSWSPNNLTVAMYSESIDFDRQRLYFVGLNGENFKSTVIDGRGFEHQWDPAGESIIYSVYSSTSELKPTLWAVSAKGESIGANRRPLELQTWAHKCAFANAQTLYCAVPDTLPEGAGLFPELAQTSTDSVYRVNLATGAKTLVAVPESGYAMANIAVSEDGAALYFTDALSGQLRTMRLR